MARIQDNRKRKKKSVDLFSDIELLFFEHIEPLVGCDKMKDRMNGN